MEKKVTINVDGDSANVETKGEKGGEVNLITPELKAKVEEVSIVAPSETNNTPVEKRVKVKMKKDHKCHIGGEWYHLLKEKQYNVPENVKEILASRDLLSPL